MSSDSKFQLPPGDYAIVNRVNASDGKRLALTFNGDGKNVTVTPFDSSSWTIENYKYDEVRATSLQHVKPKSNTKLEAALGPAVNVRPVGNYVFGITQDSSGWSIKDGDKKTSWSIHVAASGSEVVPLSESTGEKQRWVIVKAGTSLG
ncbi:hypothetical protein RHS03_08226, partial [Rhizoctonia solani]